MVKEIDFPSKFDGGKIVIHGYISPNDGVLIQVSKSVPVLETSSSDQIPGAQVFIYGDGIELARLVEIDSGLYSLPDKEILEQGIAYNIKVKTSLYGEAVTGPQYILPEIQIDTLEYLKDTITWHGEKLLYTFKDSAGVANFYSFHFEAFYHDSLILSYNPFKILEFASFNDINFPGKNTQEEYSFHSNFYHFQYDTVKIVGRLYNISPEFNTFIESLDEYDYTKESPFFDYTFPVFSNILNGYGFFGSYSFSEKKIDVLIKPKK